MEKKMTKSEQEALRQENEILKRRLEAQEAKPAMANLTDGLAQEMQKIRKKGGPSSNSLIVKEVNDHNNVSLWRKDGKRIGPLHPRNAMDTLHEFAARGILLSVDKPTPEQIAAYKETPEYKKIQAAEDKRRATKMKSKRSGQMEKLTSIIAEQTGRTAEAINNIAKMVDVGKK